MEAGNIAEGDLARIAATPLGLEDLPDMKTSNALALVGCGAIAEFAYLPALARSQAWRADTWLVEPNAQRAAEVAARFGFAPERSVRRHEELPDTVARGVDPTPRPRPHATTRALIDRGVNLIIEKPIAESATDARRMVEAAAGRGVTLSVNQSRRAGPSNRMVREIVQAGTLGDIKRIVWAEGHKVDWPSQSGFNFRRPWRGRPRGVLLDIGVHVLDLLCWWLGTAPTLVSAAMDGQGGPEAGVRAEFAVGQAVIDLRLSYLVKLRNQFLVEGTKGAVRGSTADYDGLEMRTGTGGWKTVRARGGTDPVAAATRLIANVLAASQGREALMIDAASTIAPLELIDSVYAQAGHSLPRCYDEFTAIPARRLVPEVVA